MFILPTNGGQAGIVLIAILLGIAMPITPVQILWVNMVTAVTLALALAFEEVETDIMRRAPRDPREPLLSRFLAWRIALVSVLLMTGSLGLFLWEVELGTDLDTARAVAVNTLVFGEITYLFNCRSMTASALNWKSMLGNRYVLLAIGVLLVFQLLFTYLPVMQAMFGTGSVSLAAWGRIVAFAVALMLIVEAEKFLLRRHANKPCRNQ